ncbi:hypothetical protein RHMOL_Rhmol13G0169300 [Rhododendron molle]|uniref:Uncharacterized protein n=1 Tax=Rhododendron molle TaxID=49168 RepID=A0ACC0L8Y8_RHOML|nr:hypothetical protein RHMOL_Rhmol13G0169300 [Rhododendron molle]
MDQPNLYQLNLLAEARQLKGTLRSMANQLVEDPYFPYAFPYIHDYYQEHGAFPLPEAEEEGDEEAAPILVQIAPLNDVEFVVEGVEEDPEEEDPEGDPEEDPEEFNDPPQNEADWQHLMLGPNPDLSSDDEENEGLQSDEGEMLIYEEETDWLWRVAPDVMDINSDPDDVPPPPVEDDIGPYKAQFPNIF